MNKIYSTFNYYGTKEIVGDILDFIHNNPMHLDFGELVELTYNNLMSAEAYICFTVELFDYAIVKEFVLTAELMREV